VVEPTEVVLSLYVVEELRNAVRDSESDEIAIIVKARMTDADGDLVVSVIFAMGDDYLYGFDSYFTINIDLGAHIDLDNPWWAGLNHYRITSIIDGRPIGGRLNPETGIFTLATRITGTFTIAYIEGLVRLHLALDSYDITDLAGNTNTITMDILPIIVPEANRTLLPLRFMAYALGAEIDWTDKTDTAPLMVFIALDGVTLTIPIGMLTPELEALGMDVPAQLMGNRTMVPLRFVAEFFGAVIAWDNETRSIEFIR